MTTELQHEPRSGSLDVLVGARVDAKFPLTLNNRIRLAWMAISPRTHGVLRFGYDGTADVKINQAPTKN